MDPYNPPSAVYLALALQLVLCGLFFVFGTVLRSKTRGRHVLGLFLASGLMTWVVYDMLRVYVGWQHAFATSDIDVGPDASLYSLAALVVLLFASFWPFYVALKYDKLVLGAAWLVGFAAVFTMIQDVALHLWYEDSYAIGITIGWAMMVIATSCFITAIAYTVFARLARKRPRPMTVLA
jgi:hypothetical protein